MSDRSYTLRFGIPNLDSLLGSATGAGAAQAESGLPVRDALGFTCPEGANASVCLIGSHGTGKSVLALHFAARYFADYLNQGKSSANLFYVSTDLSFPMAKDLWFNFALDTPDLRLVPFDNRYGSDETCRREKDGSRQVRLQRRTPYTNQPGNENLAQFIADDKCDPEVTFVDLAAESAGDDWGFIHRLIAVLKEPAKDAPLHLMVVDAVEGLETLVGERDAFGEKTSRRSRIAQMLRTAARKCHLLFVVEERGDADGVPEEFVSDVVIRLRSVRANGFDRRTVEVQKVRGQSHVRGQHPYVIRSGAGSFTGKQPNLDDPRQEMEQIVPATGSSPLQDSIGEHNLRVFQAYFHVMRSLHYLTRTVMYEVGNDRPGHNQQVAGFGIPHLDSLLCRSAPTRVDTHSRRGGDQYGLPCSTITALMGDAGTHKSVLGKCFLYRGLSRDLQRLIVDRSFKASIASMAILFTTSDIDANRLAETFLLWATQSKSRDWSPAEQEVTINALLERIICRRLEIHNQTPEVLMHIVNTAVTQAQARIGIEPNSRSDTRYQHSWPIRLVIDDFRIVRSMYPAVREDPLLLPFLAFYLRREGISTLIIDTQPARPDRERTEAVDDELRAIADNHLHTWRIPFHVESRIAISAMPPVHSSGRSRIRELRWDANQDPPALPEVDRGLELYTGLEQGNPKQIPLEVRLYAETERLSSYVTEMNALLGDLFVPVFPNNGQAPSKLVVGVGPYQYAYLHDLCNLQGQRVLDHTLILQVDEFWTLQGDPTRRLGDRSDSHHPLRDEREYLSTDLDTNEPRQLFKGLQATDWSGTLAGPSRRNYRASYFDLPDCPIEKNGEVVQGIDRVPFMWEFGFLLCRRDAWNAAKDDPIPIDVSPPSDQPLTVSSVQQRLPHTFGTSETPNIGSSEGPPVKGGTSRASWREFLGACDTVSKRLRSKNEQVSAFDISTISGESFCCLVLEIWASEIFDRLAKDSVKAGEFTNDISRKLWSASEENAQGLLEWLKVDAYKIDLYMSWLLVENVLPMGDLAKSGTPLTFAERLASPKAVASRQWYKTACELLTQRQSQEPMIAVGLPGHFSTRGDWFLAVARGSKSELLADRVLDIFSSRRNNFTRLYSGLGLPIRKLGEEEEKRAFLTALTWNDKEGNPQTVRYADLVALGGTSSKLSAGSQEPKSSADGFYWLWRSALRGYHRQSRVFQRWNTHIVLMWNDLKVRASLWQEGFYVYDQLKKNRPTTREEMKTSMENILKGEKVNSWTLFLQRSELLIALLEHAHCAEPEHGAGETFERLTA